MKEVEGYTKLGNNRINLNNLKVEKHHKFIYHKNYNDVSVIYNLKLWKVNVKKKCQR